MYDAFLTDENRQTVRSTVAADPGILLDRLAATPGIPEPPPPTAGPRHVHHPPGRRVYVRLASDDPVGKNNPDHPHPGGDSGDPGPDSPGNLSMDISTSVILTTPLPATSKRKRYSPSAWCQNRS